MLLLQLQLPFLGVEAGEEWGEGRGRSTAVCQPWSMWKSWK